MRGADVQARLAVVALLATTAAFFAFTTEPLRANDGFGYDGLHQTRIVRALRGGDDAPAAPHAYRLLPAAIVAVSPLEPREGFLALNLAASFGSGLLLLALLRRFGVAPGLAVLGVFWWVVLPQTVRQVIQYPTLVDAVGFFLLLVLLHAALSRHVALFAVALALAVLVRENLLVTVPFLFFQLVPQGAPSAMARTVLATLPAVFLFAVVRMWPPVPLDPQFSLDTLTLVSAHVGTIAQNVDGRVARFLAGPVLALGLLAIVPVLGGHRTLDFLRTQRGWSSYLALTLFVSFLGGVDHDRYAVPLVPLLALLTFATGGPWWRSPRTAVALTALQLVATRALLPAAGDEGAYFESMVSTMTLDTLARLTLVVLLCSGLAAAVSLRMRSASIVKETVDVGRSGT